MKTSFGGLAEKIFLGGALALGSVPFLPVSETQAQQIYVIPGYDQKMMNQAMANLAVANMTGTVANGLTDPRAIGLIRGLGQLNRDLAWVTMNQAQNRNVVIIIRDNEKNQTRETSRTFLAAGISDFPKNGLEWRHFSGLDKTAYDSNDSILPGIFLSRGANRKIDSGEVMIYSPEGKVIVNRRFRFDMDSNEWNWTKISCKEIMDNVGPGSYVAAFYVDDKFWEARKFTLARPGQNIEQTLFRTFVCSYYKDVNNNGMAEPEEFFGSERTTFKNDEKILFGMFLHGRGVKGKKWGIRCTYPDSSESDINYYGEIPKDYYTVYQGLDLKALSESKGLGTYVISFYLNDDEHKDRYWDSRSFELTEHR